MPPGPVTILLRRLEGGDPKAAEELWPLVYDELRRIAAGQLRRERAGHTLQATALVHEAFLKLTGAAGMTWEDHSHFRAVASQAIRRILVDHARARGRQKRGGNARIEIFEERGFAPASTVIDVLELDDALNRLSELHGRQARVVELKYFGGLTSEQAATVLGVSTRTVDSDWAMARAWLRRALSDEGREE